MLDQLTLLLYNGSIDLEEFITHERKKVKQPSENKKHELILDICATASILNKFGYCHILQNQTLFIAFLNELGFRTTGGKEFTKMSFRKMFERISNKERNMLVEEFSKGYRDVDMNASMFS